MTQPLNRMQSEMPAVRLWQYSGGCLNWCRCRYRLTRRPPLCGRSQVYKTPHQFTWATVRGAGHMAPLFQPLRLLDLFDRFIHKKAI